MLAIMESTARYSLEQLPVWVKISATLLFAHFLTGCGAGSLPRGAAYVENHETSIVVLGVRPQMRVQAVNVTRGSHGWNQGMSSATIINTVPEDGYVVAEVAPTKSGEAYAITTIFPGFLDIWRVCTGGTVVTFQVPPKSIVYVGEITIVEEGKYRIELNGNFAGATEFMSRNFPSMAPRLTELRAIMGVMEDGAC